MQFSKLLSSVRRIGKSQSQANGLEGSNQSQELRQQQQQEAFIL